MHFFLVDLTRLALDWGGDCAEAIVVHPRVRRVLPHTSLVAAPVLPVDFCVHGCDGERVVGHKIEATLVLGRFNHLTHAVA